MNTLSWFENFIDTYIVFYLNPPSIFLLPYPAVTFLQTLHAVFLNPLTPLSVLCVCMGVKAIYWSVGRLSRITSQKKTGSCCNRNWDWPSRVLPFHAGILADLILGICVGLVDVLTPELSSCVQWPWHAHQICCRCPLHLALWIFPVSLLQQSLSLLGRGCNINIPVRVKHSMISYSQHADHKN